MAVSQREEIIAKLSRLFKHELGEKTFFYRLTADEISRIMLDVEYARFAHEQLEHIEGKPALLKTKERGNP